MYVGLLIVVVKVQTTCITKIIKCIEFHSTVLHERFRVIHTIYKIALSGLMHIMFDFQF